MMNQKKYEERMQRVCGKPNALGVYEEHSSHFGFSYGDKVELELLIDIILEEEN